MIELLQLIELMYPLLMASQLQMMKESSEDPHSILMRETPENKY